MLYVQKNKKIKKIIKKNEYKNKNDLGCHA